MSSPKKEKPPPQLVSSPHRRPENLARYLKPDGTLARCFISFKDVANRCDTRLFETSYPLIGQKAESGNITTQGIHLPILIAVLLTRLPDLSWTTTTTR